MSERCSTSELLNEVGELGRVIGLLYQKVEALEQTTSANNQRVQEKLDSWIQTNNQLLNLIVQNSQELKHSTQAYENGTSLWSSLKQQLTNFERRMTDWTRPFVTPSPRTTDMSEPFVQDSQREIQSNRPVIQAQEELNQQLERVKQILDQFTQKLTSLTQAKGNPLTEGQSPGAERPANASQSSAPQKLKRVADLVLQSPAIALGVVGVGVSLLVLGGLSVVGIQRLQPSYRVGTPRPLSVEEADLLNWARSPEGHQARDLMRWNSGLLDDRSCEQDVKRLGVTLQLQGKLASSGFCTLWVVPPKQRKFESG